MPDFVEKQRSDAGLLFVVHLERLAPERDHAPLRERAGAGLVDALRRRRATDLG